MNAVLSTLILLAGLTQTSSATSSTKNRGGAAQLGAVQQHAAVLQQMVIQQKSTGEPALPDQAHESVLVIPTPDLPPESWAELTEDMTVMCRIFEKAVPSTRASAGFAYGNRGNVLGYGSRYGDRGEVFGFAFDQQSQRTQGLYLNGYGALFFIPVNYPLVPTEQAEPAQAQPKEPTDTVWSQTIKEMSGQPAEEPQAARSTPAYDPQRVENLKKTLIKTLAHASNIRMRRPEDVITVVVGALDDTRASDYRRARTTRPAASNAVPLSPGTGTPQPAVRNPAATLLVMRVTKADVDALAKGLLTSAQFTEKVQSLWSPVEQGTPKTAPAPSTPPRR